MTIVRRLRAADGDDLSRRAARGDVRARRLLARRHAPRALTLAGLLTDDPASAKQLAATAIASASLRGELTDDGLTRALLRVGGEHVDRDALAAVVVLLTDVEGRTEAEAADLLARPVVEVADLRAVGRRGLDLPELRARSCRGWPLAVARDRVTAPEQQAAVGHLLVCRPCTDGLRDREQARRRIVTRSMAVAAAVTDVVALSAAVPGAAIGAGGATGLAGLVGGKAAAGLLGAAAIAVATTSGVVAGTRPTDTPPAPPALTTTPAASTDGSGDRQAPHVGSTPTSASSRLTDRTPSSARPTPTTPAGTGTDVVSPPPAPLPLPVDVPTQLPASVTVPGLDPLQSVAPVPTLSSLVSELGSLLDG
jgi:hypothetical protein